MGFALFVSHNAQFQEMWIDHFVYAFYFGIHIIAAPWHSIICLHYVLALQSQGHLPKYLLRCPQIKTFSCQRLSQRMGIPDFYVKVIAILFEKALEVRGVRHEEARQGETLKKRLGKIDALYLDANALVHRAAGLAYGYAKGMTDKELQSISNLTEAQRQENLRTFLLEDLRYIANVVGARKLIVVMDGIVPATKIDQQRQRRYKAALLRSPGALFDTSAISTGTTLMELVNVWITTEFARNGTAYGAASIIYRPHRMVGEGEHAIVDLTRSGAVQTAPSGSGLAGNAPHFQDEGGYHIVYGKDLDWYMLGQLIKAKKVLLARERLDTLTDISKFGEEMKARYGLSTTDTILMALLLGNDHVPRSPIMLDMTNGFKFALDAFKELGKPITVESKTPGGFAIDWPAFMEFLDILARKEPELLASTAAQEANIVLKPTDGKLPEYGAQRSAWYTAGLGIRPDPGTLGPFFKTSNPSPELKLVQDALVQAGKPSDSRIADMVQAYLGILAWTFSYYVDGIATVRQDYYYPYAAAPCLIDVATAKKRPETATYLRCSPGMINRWEIDNLLVSLAPIMGDWEKKMYNEWLANLPADATEISLAGSDAGRRLSGHIFQRRLLTQLFLAIPPSSRGVLHPEVQKIFDNALILSDMRPSNFLMDIPSAEQKQLPTDISGMRKLVGGMFDIHLYLPNLNYRRAYVYFLRSGVSLKSLEYGSEQRYQFQDKDIQPYKPGMTPPQTQPLGGPKGRVRRDRLMIRTPK